MELRELTTELQTHSHNGDALCEAMIKIHDAYYKIKGIERTVSGNKVVFLIEASND